MIFCKEIKKIKMLLIIVIITIISNGCSEGLEQNDEFSYENLNQNVIETEIIEQKESEVKQFENLIKIDDGDVDIYNHSELEFKICIPKTWRDKYVIEESDDGIIVLHKNDFDIYAMLFEIRKSETIEDWKYKYEYTKLKDDVPFFKVGEVNGYIFEGEIASDYPYNPTGKQKSTSDEYNAMINDVNSIFMSFSSTANMDEFFKVSKSQVYETNKMNTSSRTYEDPILGHIIETISTKKQTLEEIQSLYIMGEYFAVKGNSLTSSYEIDEEKIRGGITSLSDLSYLPNLKTLVINFNDLDDVIDVGDLTSLEYLDLSNNTIETINGLDKLENLRALILKNNKLKMLSLTTQMEEIIELDLSMNQLTQLDFLNKFPNVKYLLLTDNSIENISPLLKLENLSYVNTVYNPYDDVELSNDLKKRIYLEEVDYRSGLGEEILYTLYEHTSLDLKLLIPKDANKSTVVIEKEDGVLFLQYNIQNIYRPICQVTVEDTLDGITYELKTSFDPIYEGTILENFQSKYDISIDNSLWYSDYIKIIEKDHYEELSQYKPFIPKLYYKFDTGKRYTSKMENPMIIEAPNLYIDPNSSGEIRHKSGLISSEGKLLIPPKYEGLFSFSNGLAKAYYDNSNVLINELGKVIVISEDKNIDPFIDNDYDDNRIMFKEKNNEDLYGYINRNGEVVIEAQFQMAKGFREGLAPVQLVSGEWCYIDKNGQVLIKNNYVEASKFHNGIAKTRRESDKSNTEQTMRKDIFINHDGIEIKVYENIDLEYEYFTDFSEERAFKLIWPRESVDWTVEEYDDYKWNSKWSLIDKSFNSVSQRQFQEVSDFVDGYAVVRVDDYYGVIDRDGEIIIPFEYDELKYSNGIFLYSDDDLWGAINSRNEGIINPIYSYLYYDAYENFIYKKDNLYGLINKTGDISFPNIFNHIWNSSDIFYNVEFCGISAVIDQKNQMIWYTETMKGSKDEEIKMY